MLRFCYSDFEGEERSRHHVARVVALLELIRNSGKCRWDVFPMFAISLQKDEFGTCVMLKSAATAEGASATADFQLETKD